MPKVSVFTSTGEWALTDKHWVAQGGEADIYKKGQQAVKVYKDKSRAMQQGLENRVSFAKKWQHLAIAAPAEVAYNKQREPIGIVLPWLNGTPILTAFNNDWRTLHGFDAVETSRVVAELRTIVAGVHATGAVMVDGNEWNYMLDAHMKAWAIDADSWCIPGHHATARMPSIEDVHTAGCDEGSDWFAWAIVTFQLWTGIHPYKGTHPDFKKGDMRSRMLANVSIFHSDVRTPSTVRPVSDIPAGLCAWYEGVFERGLRTEPPAPAQWRTASGKPIFHTRAASITGVNVLTTAVRTAKGMVARGDALWDGVQWLRWDGTAVFGPIPAAPTAKQDAWQWEAQPNWFLSLRKSAEGWVLTDDKGVVRERPGMTHAWKQNGLMLAGNDDAVEQWDVRRMHTSGWLIHAPWRWLIPAGWRQDNNVRYWSSLGGVCALWSNGAAGRIERFPLLDGRKIRNWRQEGSYALVVVEEGSGLELWVWNPDAESINVQKHNVEDANVSSAHIGDMLIYWVDDNEGIIRGSRSSEALVGPVPKLTPMVGRNNQFFGLFEDGIKRITKKA
jgi:hypothetical protein